ncbi:MAG: ester cyclase [Chloroflexota bacterium]
MLTTEANKAIVRQWFDLWNQHSLDALSDMVSSNYIHHTSRGADINFASFKLGFEMVLQTFPDIQYNIVHMIAEDEMVAAYLTAEGTQQGKFVGLKPTNKTAKFTGVYHCRIQDGRIVEDWDIFDLLSALLQVGAVIQPG